MSSPTQLALLLSLVACEHADLATHPQTPIQPEPSLAPQPAPEPAPEPAVVEPTPPAEPAIAPTQPQLRVQPYDADTLDRRCMSRAGCRWEGENKLPRVVKKAPAQPTEAPATPK